MKYPRNWSIKSPRSPRARSSLMGPSKNLPTTGPYENHMLPSSRDTRTGWQSHRSIPSGCPWHRWPQLDHHVQHQIDTAPDTDCNAIGSNQPSQGTVHTRPSREIRVGQSRQPLLLLSHRHRWVPIIEQLQKEMQTLVRDLQPLSPRRSKQAPSHCGKMKTGHRRPKLTPQKPNRR